MHFTKRTKIDQTPMRITDVIPCCPCIIVLIVIIVVTALLIVAFYSGAMMAPVIASVVIATLRKRGWWMTSVACALLLAICYRPGRYPQQMTVPGRRARVAGPQCRRALGW